MKKVAGRTRVSLGEIRKLKGRSNIASLYKQQNEERGKPTSKKQ